MGSIKARNLAPTAESQSRAAETNKSILSNFIPSVANTPSVAAPVQPRIEIVQAPIAAPAPATRPGVGPIDAKTLAIGGAVLVAAFFLLRKR